VPLPHCSIQIFQKQSTSCARWKKQGEQKILSVKAANEQEFDAAFKSIVQAGAGALAVIGSPLKSPSFGCAVGAPLSSDDL